MPKIHEVRENIDKKLDKLETKAVALESQLNETRESAVSRIESEKQAYRDIVQRIKNEIVESKAVASNAKQELYAAIEHAEVQLALGKADTRDAIHEQRKKIGRAVAELEAKVDLKFEQVEEEMIEGMVAAADRLDAVLEAAAIRLENENTALDEKLSEKKREVASQIEAYKKNIAEKRQEASKKWANFEDELGAGIEKVTSAFKQLFT